MALNLTTTTDMVDMDDELGPLDPDGIAPGSALDELVAELLAPPSERPPFTCPIPGRPGWSIEMRVELSKADKEALLRQQKKLIGVTDEKRLLELVSEVNAFTVAYLCTALYRRGQVVTAAQVTDGGADAPVTLRHKAFLDMLGVDKASAAARKLLGDDAAGKVVEGWTEARNAWPDDDDGGLDPRP